MTGMTNMHDQFPLAEDLDRLVDEEMSADERRAFLIRLDEAPQGWRQCALAFLEAQAWQHDLRHATPAPTVAPLPILTGATN